MIVLVHVLVALCSIAFSTYAFFWPSYSKLKVNYALVGLTLVSGTYLVISTHSNMLQACMTGLFYLGIVSAGIAGARYKLAKETARN